MIAVLSWEFHLDGEEAGTGIRLNNPSKKQERDMVTTVGLNSDFHVVLRNLISLDFDAADAYQAAIDRLENQSFKQKLAEFKEDHLRHTRELSEIVRGLGEEPPTETDAKDLLTKGKVVIAGLMGDRAILMAMKTNEDDTNTAYERAVKHGQATAESRSICERNLADERRHRQWILSVLDERAAA
jgi:uncharacterized protein (TIGR02284 family)